MLRAISFRYCVEGLIKFIRTILLTSTSFITTISFYMDDSRWVRNMYIRKLRQHISQTSICSCVRFETIDCQVSNGISCNGGDKGQFILSGEAVTTSLRVTCLQESHVCALHCQLCLNYSHTRPVFAQCFTLTSFSL